jgi:hypothetical protein
VSKTNAGRVRKHPSFLPGVLLIAGPLTLLLGASVTGQPWAPRPGDYLLNTTAIFLGSLLLVGVFVALNLVLALVVTTGIILAGVGSVVAAWTAYILTAPFMVFILPYFVDTALLKGGGGKSTGHKDGVATASPIAYTVRGV